MTPPCSVKWGICWEAKLIVLSVTEIAIAWVSGPCTSGGNTAIFSNIVLTGTLPVLTGTPPPGNCGRSCPGTYRVCVWVWSSMNGSSRVFSDCRVLWRLWKIACTQTASHLYESLIRTNRNHIIFAFWTLFNLNVNISSLSVSEITFFIFTMHNINIFIGILLWFSTNLVYFSPSVVTIHSLLIDK